MTGRRDDLLVSVCVADTPPDEATIGALEQLGRRLTERYRYFELLVAVRPDAAHSEEALLRRVANIRVLRVRHGTPFYRTRYAVASEAIGDLVALVALEELALVDVVEMLERADATGSIVIGRRTEGSVLNPLVRGLGRGAGFRADVRDMLTAAFPRPLLNKLLRHPDRELALRFPPSDPGVSVSWQPARGRAGRSFRDAHRRLGLLQKLLVSSAPRVLTLVSILSLVVTASGIAFTVYAVVVWLTFTSVQPGWFTTAFVLGLTAAFLGGAIFGLTIGLQKVLETQTNEMSDEIIDERGAADLFGQVKHELNVAVEARDRREA